MHIAVVVGEVSGDRLAASILAAIQAHIPNLQVSGILGPATEALGFSSQVPMERLSVMGFWEPLKRLPELLRIRRNLLNQWLSDPPDFFIGVDSPEFTLSIEKVLRPRGIRTVHVVSPSVWAWRQGRINTMKKTTDLMLTLFPFEEAIYQQHGIPVACIGHPLADEIPITIDTAVAKRELGLSPKDTVVALLPGSRQAELARMMPLYLDAAERIYAGMPTVQFVVPVVSETHAAWVQQLVHQHSPNLPLQIRVAGMRPCVSAADVALVTSGTATLEVMLHQKPMVVAYRLNPITYAILKRMVHVPYIALPNLLAGERLVPELIDSAATPITCADAVMALLQQNSVQREALVARFRTLHQSLHRQTGLVAYQALVAQGFLPQGDRS